MERIEVFLTPQQHKKFMHHEPFQLSASQLKESDKHIGKKFHVELQLTKTHYKKLLSNVKAGKGYRFTKEAIMGGSLLGEMWEGAKKAVGAVGNVVNKVGEYIPADMIRQGVKTGLTGLATVAGTMVGNPELGLLASPFINKGVDYAEKGYNYMKDKKEPKDVMQDAYERYAPSVRKYVEDRVPMARKAREYYDEYAPRARKVYRKARKVYYQEPDDEDDEDDEDEYEPPPPPPRRRRKAKSAPQPHYSPPAPTDYSGYSGRGLKKGSPEMKAKMARLRAMRKGGEIEDGKYFNARTTPMTPAETQAWLKSPNNPFKDSDNKYGYEEWNMPGYVNPLIKGVKGGRVQDYKYFPSDPYKTMDDKNNLSNGAGLKKGSPEAKKWGAKMKAMRKGGEMMNIPYETRRTRRQMGLGGRVGGDLWGDFVGAVSNAGNQISDALDPNKNGVGDALDPNKNGVSNLVNQIGDTLRGSADNVVSFYQSAVQTSNNAVNQAITEVAKSLPSEADAKAFGKQLASALIHQGIPQATAAICGVLAEAVFPEGGPIAGQLGSEVGKMLGDKLADEVGKQTGYGFRRHHGHKVLVRGGTLLHGVPYPHISPETHQRIMTHGLDFKHKGKNGLHKGGSFAPLGGGV